jgi:(+)-trans-carveol dehydrogenase
VDTPMIMNDMTKRRFVPGVATVSDEQFSAASQSLHALPVPWVQSSDISAALAFLVSDEARYITGVSLPVDAGALLL